MEETFAALALDRQAAALRTTICHGFTSASASELSDKGPRSD
jgi:hypothetical protein